MTNQKIINALTLIKDRLETDTELDMDILHISSLWADDIGHAIEALKKQVPKKMDMYSEGHTGDLIYKCPTCGEEYNRFYKCKPYCMFCGQKILWEEEE